MSYLLNICARLPLRYFLRLQDNLAAELLSKTIVFQLSLMRQTLQGYWKLLDCQSSFIAEKTILLCIVDGDISKGMVKFVVVFCLNKTFPPLYFLTYIPLCYSQYQIL